MCVSAILLAAPETGLLILFTVQSEDIVADAHCKDLLLLCWREVAQIEKLDKSNKVRSCNISREIMTFRAIEQLFAHDYLLACPWLPKPKQFLTRLIPPHTQKLPLAKTELKSMKCVLKRLI